MNKDSYILLDSETQKRLHAIVFEREHNEKHPDDYFNAGGFFAHWSEYTDEERLELLKEAQR